MHAPPPHAGAFGKDLGLEVLSENADGSVEVELDITDKHLRANGIAHGGVLFTMLDSAMAAAVARTLTKGEWIASVSITIDFLKAAENGRVVAKGWVERRGQTTAFPRSVAHDAEGNVVARASGIWAIRPTR
ncbi:MAG: PaaI family thioesterase [Candidatus Thermoplasmatota archaeon]